MKTLAVGDKVRYRVPENDREAKAVFTVTELNGDRGFMTLECDMQIKPSELFSVSDVVPVATPESLAAEFCRVLNEWLTPDQIAEVNARNAAETDENICHSHDFCDANQAMLDAMAVFGLDFESTDEQNTLINAAWDLAKAAGFSIKGR